MNTITRALVLAAGTVSFPGTVALPAQETVDTCVECHRAFGGELAETVEAFAEGVHVSSGFGCSACHGGDPTIAGPEAMDPAVGYIGVPSKLQELEVCGRCHSSAEFMRRYNPSLHVDQVTEYVTSVHGQQLLGAGDTLVATCSSCHGAHGIRPASDPTSSVHPLQVAGTCGACHSDAQRMAQYSIPTDQQEKYGRSVHWRAMSEDGDTSAPTCNDCHGNHGAAPPGVSWVGNVCGGCHVVMGEYFQASRHSRTFEALGIPGCASCHRNHDVSPAGDELLGLGEGAACRACHSESDPGGQKASTMRGVIDTLRVEIDSARTVLQEAENHGMEVSAALVGLTEAQSALVKARAAVHTFEPDLVRGEIEPGREIASASLTRGLAALRDLQTRRLGLAVSVIIIGALVVGLVLKIRDMETPA